MTTASSTRGPLRRTARLGMAGAALLAAMHGASADEGGLGDFLSSIFGAQPRPAQQAVQAPAAGYAPSYGRSYTRAYAPAYVRHRRPRSLTVRLNPARPRVVVAQAPVKPGKVSIFEDQTLRRGDAVMMADGVRVFAGSASFPYTAADFVALKDARTLDRDTTRVLAQLDKLPRG